MLEIQTFGTVGLRNRDGTESQAQIVQPKRLALLIYLALAPRRRCRRRDQVVTLFWPELDQEHARGVLSQALASGRVGGIALSRTKCSIMCSWQNLTAYNATSCFYFPFS